jgi:hypothetical protein
MGENKINEQQGEKAGCWDRTREQTPRALFRLAII